MIIGQTVDIDCLDHGDAFCYGIGDYPYVVLGRLVVNLNSGRSWPKSEFFNVELTYLGCIFHMTLNEILPKKV